MDTADSLSATERARLAVILATIAISVGGVVLFSLVPWSDWRTGLLLNLVENAILVAFSIRYRDRLMPHLMLFGFAVGLAELPADAWLVQATGTLDYSIGGGPTIWRSPAWMPLAWGMVAVQFGYLGMRLYEWRKGWGLLLAGAIGAVNIPFYEEMALRTHWWRYADCRMLLHTPYYIIVGEFLIAVAIGSLARSTRSGRWSRSLAAGVLAGLAILPCYVVAFRATEGWTWR